MSRWLPALRIARRTVLRSPGRSLLVALLIGLPVAGATTLDVLIRSMTSPEHRVQRQIGSADAVVTGLSATRLAALTPTGTRIAPAPLTYVAFLERGARAMRTQLVVADVREPLHRHAARVDEGRAPTGAGEVLVTRVLARRLHMLDGDGRLLGGAEVTLRRGPSATVTGIAREPFCLDCAEVIAAPGSPIAAAVGSRARGFSEYIAGSSNQEHPFERPLLVDLPERASALELATLVRGRGVEVVSRARVTRAPESDYTGTAGALGVALVTVLVALGLLEIVLLAGTAFAVGARRQLRELGLVAASGGSPQDVRRVVLAQGLALGLLGAAAGAVAGVAGAVAGRSLWEGLYDEELTGWAFSSWELGGIALLGLLSGLAAAVVPAVGAGRMRPIHALAGRVRAAGPLRRRNALAGAGLLVIGVVLGLAGDHVFAAELARAGATSDVGFGRHASSDGAIALVVAGGTAAVVGLVLLAPALIGGLARLGGRLPLSARLAVRDAERHRHRTGPATGAITVAVAVAVATACIVAMVFRADEQDYVPMLPANTIAIESQNPQVPRSALVGAADAAAAEVPGGRRTIVRLTAGAQPAHLLRPGIGCPELTVRVVACERALGRPRPAVVDPFSASAATAAGGALDRAARDALAAGEVVVFDPAMLDRAGNVLVQRGPQGRRMPGHLLRRDTQYGDLPSGLVSTSLAAAQGWPTAISAVLVTFSSDASDEAVDSAMAVAADARLAVAVESRDAIERNTILLVVALIAGLVTLFSVAISVALSAAEGRADLATLAAVGAPPRRRRSLVACHALLVGSLGGLLGLGLGTFVAFTARSITGSPDFVVPWWNLLAAGVGAPLVAAVVAALCTHGRLPLVRRAE